MGAPGTASLTRLPVTPAAAMLLLLSLALAVSLPAALVQSPLAGGTQASAITNCPIGDRFRKCSRSSMKYLEPCNRTGKSAFQESRRKRYGSEKNMKSDEGCKKLNRREALSLAGAAAATLTLQAGHATAAADRVGALKTPSKRSKNSMSEVQGI